MMLLNQYAPARRVRPRGLTERKMKSFPCHANEPNVIRLVIDDLSKTANKISTSALTGRRVPLYERSGEGERASASGLVALAQSGGEDAGPARPDGDES